MIQRIALSLLLLASPIAPAWAAQLIMVEQAGCHYCQRWHAEIGPIYPKTDEGAFAPLKRMDIRSAPPKGVKFVRRVNFTPTFILVENGTEAARIEGYPGEDFFWGLLDVMLRKHTEFTGTGG